jgi:hypothetical protein
VSATFSAISASRKARQALRDALGLVGEVDHLDAVLTVQPGDLGGELVRIAMAEARPEAALAAVVAGVRAAARELHHDGALAAPVAVTRVIDQLPADPESVEVGDHRGRRGADHHALVAERDPADCEQRAAVGQRAYEAGRRLLALAAHDHIDLRLLDQDLAPMIGREHAAVDDPDIGQLGAQRAGQLAHDRMARGRARMAEQDRVGSARDRLRDDVLDRHRPELGVDQRDVVPGVDQRTAD